jgi:hypothetical protein
MVEIGAGARLAGKADQRFGNNGAVLGLIMPEIGADGARPVDIGMTGTTGATLAVKRASQRLDGAMLQPLHEIVDNFLYDNADGILAPFRDRRSERHEIGDEMHVGFQRLEEFRLHQQILQVKPLEGVLLDHLNQRGGKKLANVAEPARNARRRRAEPALAFFGLRSV